MPNQLDRLLSIMKRLRDPENGCEWDRAQNFATIAPYTIEEAYEVADSIRRNAMDELLDELGDLLFQIVFYAQMANEQDLFDFYDIAEAISDKMESRHPHIFNNVQLQRGRTDWEEIKAAERTKKGARSAMDGVALTLPELMRAAKLQKRAARVGFDWEEVSGPRNKLMEELEELDNAADGEKKLEEAGDVLFSVVNILRHYGVDPESALRVANRKFERRFRSMEQVAQQGEVEFADLALKEKERIWQKIKAKEIDKECD